jgi:hypothetical protein
VGGDRGGWGVLGEAELEGWESPIFVGAADTAFYSLFFLIYYLKRTTNGRPYIGLFDLKTDDQWSPLH